MSIHKTEAIVIRRFDFRETSLISTFYTKDFGKVDCLFKGIRQEPQKFASTVDIFSHNEIIFYKKQNTSLHLVSQCDLRDNFPFIRSDIMKVGLVSFMLELLSALVAHEDKNEEIFDLALNCIRQINSDNNAGKIATIFKVKMLALSGFKPHFDSCVSCNNRLIGQARFSSGMGGLLCESCFKKDFKATLVFRGTVASILHIEKNDLASNLRLGMNPQIKKELDMLLNSFIEYHLEKRLKSQKVLENLENITV